MTDADPSPAPPSAPAPAAGASPLVERVCAWVAEVLELPSVAPGDNFVELGGNSLLAVILVNRVDEELGIRPDILDVFGLDLAALAARLEAAPT